MQAAHFTTKAVGYVFLALIISLGFMRPYVRTAGMAIQLTDLLFVLFAAVIFYQILSTRTKPAFDTFTVLVAAYFTSLALSAAFSMDVTYSFKRLAGESYLLMLALLTREAIARFDLLKPTVFALIAAGTVASVIGTLTVIAFYLDKDSFLLTYFLHHYGSLVPGNYPRVHGTFIYPAMLCNFLTFSLLLIAAARYLGWIGRNVFFILLVPHLITISFTVTPGIGGAVFAIMAWFAVVFAARGKKAFSKLSYSIGIVAAAFFTLVSAFSLRAIPSSPYHFEIYGLRLDPTQRLLTWQESLQTFLADPLTGIGVGLGTANVFFLAPSGQRQLLTDAHNVFLSVAGQSGIFALVVIILLIAFVIKRSLPWKPEQNDPVSVIRVALGIAFVSGFVVQGIVGAFENARHLWIAAGILAALPESDPARE